MTDQALGTAAGDIFAKAFTLGYETGRNYIPAGGMALTAEQVEDVRLLAQRLRHISFRGGVQPLVISDALALLDALFLATEPADKEKPVKFRKMTAKYATANFGFPDVTVDPFTPFTRWAYKDTDGDKWVWNGDQWELHIVPPAPAEPAEQPAREGDCALLATHDGPCMPAPAEPAEEETKADPWIVQLPEGMTMEQWIESLPDEAPGLLAAVREVRERLGISSPVVSAPTETGPWQTVDAIPESVTRIKDCEGDVWHRCTAGWEHGGLHGPGGYATFVAAEGN